jgi:hypothetical protein
MADDPLQQRAFADAIVERAADQLRQLLRQLARAGQPFPPFPGAMFVHAIEVEPPPGSAHGCVIVTDDGDLHELQIGLDEDEIARGGDHVATRHEAAVLLELAPADFIPYALRAVHALANHLEAVDRGVM